MEADLAYPSCRTWPYVGRNVLRANKDVSLRLYVGARHLMKIGVRGDQLLPLMSYSRYVTGAEPHSRYQFLGAYA